MNQRVNPYENEADCGLPYTVTCPECGALPGMACLMYANDPNKFRQWPHTLRGEQAVKLQVADAKRKMAARKVICDASANPHSYAVCSCTVGHTNARIWKGEGAGIEPVFPPAKPSLTEL